CGVAAPGEPGVVEDVGHILAELFTHRDPKQVVGPASLELGSDGAITIAQLEVLPMDRSGGETNAGDVDDHRTCTRGERRLKATAEQVATEVVEREGRLVA